MPGQIVATGKYCAGTALMTAAEEWGRRRGAIVAVTDTNLRSPPRPRLLTRVIFAS